MTHPGTGRRSPHLRYQENWAWRAANALDRALRELTGRWTGKDEVRGETLRRLASSAADHIAIGCERREARPFRAQLKPALEKLAEVGISWAGARERMLVQQETWEEIEGMRDRAYRLTLGLFWALNKQVAKEKRTLKGISWDD